MKKTKRSTPLLTEEERWAISIKKTEDFLHLHLSRESKADFEVSTYAHGISVMFKDMGYTPEDFYSYVVRDRPYSHFSQMVLNEGLYLRDNAANYPACVAHSATIIVDYLLGN